MKALGEINEMRTLNLTKSDIYNITMAVASVRCKFVAELAEEDITEARRKIAEGSLKMWNKLHKKITAQLKDQAIK